MTYNHNNMTAPKKTKIYYLMTKEWKDRLACAIEKIERSIKIDSKSFYTDAPIDNNKKEIQIYIKFCELMAIFSSNKTAALFYTKMGIAWKELRDSSNLNNGNIIVKDVQKAMKIFNNANKAAKYMNLSCFKTISCNISLAKQMKEIINRKSNRIEEVTLMKLSRGVNISKNRLFDGLIKTWSFGTKLLPKTSENKQQDELPEESNVQILHIAHSDNPANLYSNERNNQVKKNEQ